MMIIEIEENDDWIDDFQTPKEVQDTVRRVQELEIELAKMKLVLQQVTGRWK